MTTSRTKITSVDHEIDVLTVRMVSAAEDPSDHRAIYDHIVNNILPSVRQGASSPPLHLVTYAIRNIISPTLLYQLIPQLLTLLAHVDNVRQKFLKRLGSIIAWDDHYKLDEYRNKDINVLDESERNFLMNTKTELGDEMRRAYRTIVVAFSQLDVYETWFSPKCDNVEELLSIYFPSDDDDSPALLFHYGLSEEEREELNSAKDDSLELLERYIRDTEEGRVVDPLSSDARKVYTPPVDKEELIQLTRLYLERLGNAVEKTNAILSSA